jgi:hypothetical protein
MPSPDDLTRVLSPLAEECARLDEAIARIGSLLRLLVALAVITLQVLLALGVFIILLYRR